jgi:hypothetical protein
VGYGRLPSTQTPKPTEQNWESVMPNYSAELIPTMRLALEEVMTQIPLNQATTGIKAYMAEFILKAAAEGETSYDGLIAKASSQIKTILAV